MVVEVAVLCDVGRREERWGEPEFFEGDGDFDAIGGLGCVEVYIGGFVG